MALKFHGSKFSRITLHECFIARIHGQNVTPTKWVWCTALEDSRALSTQLQYYSIGALYSASLFPTSTFSAFVFRYLGVPLTFAGSSWQLQYWQISHMMVATSWENSPGGPGSLHFDYCPCSLLKYSNRATKLAVAHVG